MCLERSKSWSRIRQEERTPRKNVEDSRTGGVGVRVGFKVDIERSFPLLPDKTTVPL